VPRPEVETFLKTFWLILATTLVLGAPAFSTAEACTARNALFVRTGELIKHAPNDYSIKEPWIEDDNNLIPMKCYIDSKALRQILAVCHVGDLCIVSAKGESGNDNSYVIHKIFEVRRSSQKVDDLKKEYVK
jgi:hypothetical protein